jgi:hypothetical protein
MEKNEIVKSEIGSEAAWRGFSTQTLYIAKRLLTSEDDEQLYPEQVEDLMIMRKGKIIELVFKGKRIYIKKRWEEKVSNIAKDLMAIDSMQRQYQRTIIPLYDYKSNKTNEELLNDYRMGVNARPDHRGKSTF